MAHFCKIDFFKWIHQYKKNREKYICLFLFIDIFSSALYVIDFERGERAKGE